MVGNLYLLLRAGCPAHLKVVLAPFAVALSEDTEVQPDLLVAPRTAGVTSYWLVDPVEVSVRVLELVDGLTSNAAMVWKTTRARSDVRGS